VEGFGGIINNITTNNYLTFANEEIPVEGRGHNRALHVSVKCLDHIVAKVLIDNGSSLNVMPKATLDKFPFNASYLWPSSMVMRDFDGSRQDVKREIDLPIQIRPHVCQISFQVMDINPAYRSLLGRPWIPLSWGSPFNAPPKVEICGGRAIDHSLGGGRNSCK